MIGWSRLRKVLTTVVGGLVMLGAFGFPTSHADRGDTESGVRRDRPVKLIYDTDFGGDVDDAGVAAMLNAMQDNGEVDVLAMMASNPTRHAAPGLDAINTYYRHGNIPIGTVKPVFDHVPSPPTPGAVVPTNNVSGYAELLARGWKNNIRDSGRAPEAVDLYRKILAKQRHDSVVIVVVGGQLNLAALLDSGPDRHSRLTGTQLVRRKVNRLVVMGGQFPRGREWNIMLDPGAAAEVAQEWPSPVVYSGFEIGESVKTGSRLFTEVRRDNPVLNAYEDYVGWGNSRSSWDQTAAYYAVRGGDGMFDLSEPGEVEFAADGSNTWRPDPDGTRYHLTKIASDRAIATAIEDLMVQPSKRFERR